MTPADYYYTGYGTPPDSLIQIPLDNSASDAEQILSTIDGLAAIYGNAPYVRKASHDLLPTSLRNNDKQGQLGAVLTFVVSAVTYVSDPLGVEFLRSPVKMLHEIGTKGKTVGDCDDYVLFTNSLLNSLGFKTRAKCLKVFNKEHYDHVISQIYYGNEWVDFDACNPKNFFPDYAKYPSLILTA